MTKQKLVGAMPSLNLNGSINRLFSGKNQHLGISDINSMDFQKRLDYFIEHSQHTTLVLIDIRSSRHLPVIFQYPATPRISTAHKSYLKSKYAHLRVEINSQRLPSLPMGPQIRVEQSRFSPDTIKQFFEHKS